MKCFDKYTIVLLSCFNEGALPCINVHAYMYSTVHVFFFSFD